MLAAFNEYCRAQANTGELVYLSSTLLSRLPCCLALPSHHRFFQSLIHVFRRVLARVEPLPVSHSTRILRHIITQCPLLTLIRRQSSLILAHNTSMGFLSMMIWGAGGGRPKVGFAPLWGLIPLTLHWSSSGA